MMIGKADAAVTSISTADADSITVRGRDLTSDLMGRVSFTEYFYLLVTGREPTKISAFSLICCWWRSRNMASCRQTRSRG